MSFLSVNIKNIEKNVGTGCAGSRGRIDDVSSCVVENLLLSLYCSLIDSFMGWIGCVVVQG